MKYSIDITNIYPRLINLDNTSGIKTFLSIPSTKGELTTIQFENVEINIDEDDWLQKIREQNPENIITESLSFNNFDFKEGIASILLRKATLIIKNIKASFLKLSGDGEEVYDSHENNFDPGDKYIWLAGESSEYHKKEIEMKIIFSGSAYLQFDEDDFFIQMIDFRSLISKELVKTINEYQYGLRELKGKHISHDTFNNIESKFMSYEYASYFFDRNENCNIAYRPFSIKK